MPIRFPGHVQTPAERHDFLLRLQEHLRRHGARQCRQIRLAQGLGAAQQWHRRWLKPRNLAICRALNAARLKAFKPQSHPDDTVPWAARKRTIRRLPDDDSTFVGADLSLIEPDENDPGGLDPLEDFTTYEVIDPQNNLDITANQITFTNVGQGWGIRVWQDKGDGHFGSSFEHLLECLFTSSELRATIHVWALSHVVDSAYNWWMDQNEAVSVSENDTFAPYFSLRNFEEQQSDMSADIQLGTQYYLTVSRSDETVVCEIYTDPSRTAEYLFDTLTVSVPAARTYRHILAVNTEDSGTDRYYLSGMMANLDLQEGGGPPPPTGVAPQFMHLARMRRA